MLLNEIITGKRRSRFVLITDNIEQGGANLLNAIIQSYVDKKSEIHVACFERHVSSFKEIMRTTQESDFHFHDLFTDHLGWLGRNSENNVKANLERIDENARDNYILVIDSLASVMINSNSVTLYKLLHRCISPGSKVQQIIGLLHKDMVENFELAEISHLASTVLKIEPPRERSHGRPLCYVTHRTSKGKVLREVEHYSVDACNRLWSEPFSEAVPSKPVKPVDVMADVTTFRLTLEEKEKEARSQLVLPYLRNEAVSETVGSGVIHYVPDEGDDWDEEDPDNDLNI